MIAFVNKSVFSLMLSLLIACSTLVGQEDTLTDWNLAKDKNGIQVYTRDTENSKFKEYKSVTEMSASPERLLEILLDVEDYTTWMSNVKVAEILDQQGEDNYYIYSEVNVPWPFDNRDQITLSEVIREPSTGSIRIRITILPDYKPEKKGVVRVSSGNGLWAFTPLGNGKTRVYHRFAGDPGGSIPAWVVNIFLVDGPYKNMIGLREKIAE
ncbi:MAG: START domain-containing protein [bacterium]